MYIETCVEEQKTGEKGVLHVCHLHGLGHHPNVLEVILQRGKLRGCFQDCLLFSFVEVEVIVKSCLYLIGTTVVQDNDGVYSILDQNHLIIKE